jgi:hypothetical protein
LCLQEITNVRFFFIYTKLKIFIYKNKKAAYNYLFSFLFFIFIFSFREECTEDDKYSYIRLRQFTETSLVFPSTQVINMLHTVTAYMDKHKNQIMTHSQPRKGLLKMFELLPFTEFPCHKIKHLVLNKYINIKIHYWAKKIVADPISKSSKTVCGILQK